VKVDELNLMCVGYKLGTSRYVKHDEWKIWSFKVTEKGEVAQPVIDVTEYLRSDKIEEHGWWMWSAWFVVGFLLLATKRYSKKNWVVMHYLHALLGGFVLVVTIIFALSVTTWAPFEELHNGIGSLCVVVTIFGSLSGSVTAAMMKFYDGDKPWIKEEKVQFIARVHRYSGYTMLFIGNASIMTGLGFYFGDRLEGDERRVLGIFSFVVFCILVAIFEAIFRIRNKYSMGHVPTPTKQNGKSLVLSTKDVEKQIEGGKTLVIFDNLVLDLNGYERIHPGGKFNLRHNVGRDISKFFFGGYSLVNIPKRIPHHHS